MLGLVAAGAATGRSSTLLWTAGAPALFVVLWSTGFVFSKESLKYAEPMTILAIRFGAASALALVLTLAGRAAWPARHELPHVVVVGLLVHGCYIGGVFAAIDHGLPAGLAALVVGLQPLVSACLVGVLLGERVTPIQWVGCLLGFAGVVLVLWTKLTFDRATAGAILLCVLALAGITAGTLYQKRFCADVDVRSSQVVQYAAAALAVLTLALLFEDMSVRWTAALVGSLAWMVLVLSIGTISLLLVLIRHGAAVRTASLFYLVPPVTALMAWAWFDETLGPVALAGLAVAAVGVALVQRGGREPIPAPVPE
jgi:drug/metabolite transporter (DMT)-like permease